MSREFNRKEIQGNILRGDRRSRVRHLILEVADRAAARKFLAYRSRVETRTFPGSPRGAMGRRSRTLFQHRGSPTRGCGRWNPRPVACDFPTEFTEG